MYMSHITSHLPFPAGITTYNDAVFHHFPREGNETLTMHLLPDTQNYGLRMHRECREHASRHVRDSCAVMPAEIAN